MRHWVVHAEYLIWSMWAVKRANDEWRARRPYPGETILCREGLHSHLFDWGVTTGRIPDPGPERDMPHSYYVSLIYRDDMDAVKKEARCYWHRMVRARMAAL